MQRVDFSHCIFIPLTETAAEVVDASQLFCIAAVAFVCVAALVGLIGYVVLR